MRLPIYQIDAFASEPFTGNPAAVCPLKNWLPDATMQAIAAENNLSETAFFVPKHNGFHIRWFTPVAEVDLCGHATLAAAYVVFNDLGVNADTICFESKSGPLRVAQEGELLVMDFPLQPPVPCQIPDEIVRAFTVKPIECLESEDYIVVFENEEDLLLAEPDLLELSKLNLRGVAITAKSSKYDFVARFFGPKLGINEDPVTGSAYTQLVPYWAERLGVERLHAKQLSKRGGELLCEVIDDRVNIAGRAVRYLTGEIEIDA
jgi:predicted PhzF superfamily epimerase YddE/YHI9